MIIRPERNRTDVRTLVVRRGLIGNVSQRKTARKDRYKDSERPEEPRNTLYWCVLT